MTANMAAKPSITFFTFSNVKNVACTCGQLQKFRSKVEELRFINHSNFNFSALLEEPILKI